MIGHVSFLTDCVLMTPKQHRVILWLETIAIQGRGLFVRPVKRCISGCRNRICIGANRCAQALHLSAGYGDFEGCHECMEVGLAVLVKGVVVWVCVFEGGGIFSSFGYPYFRIQYITQKHPTNEGDARHDNTGVS